MFRAILVNRDDQGYHAEVTMLDEAQLPAGDVLISVLYSSLNYKDALAITGRGPVIRQFPIVPGIDLVGIVEHSDHPDFRRGDQVLLNGCGVGEVHWGGLAEKARLSGDCLIPLPSRLTPRQVMIVGTAGYTAMLCVMALQRQGLAPDAGEVLVTGANGGVGSFAVALLARLGYRVVAVTGRTEETDYLHSLGAAVILPRSDFNEPGKPFQKERWAGAIDCVGSHTLANVLAGIRYGGVVAACGLAQGAELPTSVLPFILRGVTLVGVDSVMAPRALRLDAWEQLSCLVDDDLLADIGMDIDLEQAIDAAGELLDGRIRGRLVVAI